MLRVELPGMGDAGTEHVDIAPTFRPPMFGDAGPSPFFNLLAWFGLRFPPASASGFDRVRL